MIFLPQSIFHVPLVNTWHQEITILKEMQVSYQHISLKNIHVFRRFFPNCLLFLLNERKTWDKFLTNTKELDGCFTLLYSRKGKLYLLYKISQVNNIRNSKRNTMICKRFQWTQVWCPTNQCNINRIWRAFYLNDCNFGKHLFEHILKIIQYLATFQLLKLMEIIKYAKY